MIGSLCVSHQYDWFSLFQLLIYDWFPLFQSPIWLVSFVSVDWFPCFSVSNMSPIWFVPFISVTDQELELLAEVEAFRRHHVSWRSEQNGAYQGPVIDVPSKYPAEDEADEALSEGSASTFRTVSERVESFNMPQNYAQPCLNDLTFPDTESGSYETRGRF